VAGWITGRTSGLAAGTTFWTTASATCGLAAIDNFVSAGFQSLFRFVTHTAIAVSQSVCQRFDDFVSHAAASVAANLVTDFVSSLMTDPFVTVVQGVHKCTHDLRVAAAVITIAKAIDRFGTMFRVTGCLRFVDQFSDSTGVVTAAVVTTAWL
jgi:hypothetical protein